jgi:threonine dehydratase
MIPFSMEVFRGSTWGTREVIPTFTDGEHQHSLQSTVDYRWWWQDDGMDLVTIEDVRAAAERIKGVAVRTPLLSCLWGDPKRPLWIKPENLQPTGAFKIRGAHNAVARLTGQPVVAHSSGNHAQALAYAARAAGVPATIVMPDSAPTVKIERTRALGAEVVLVPIAEREERAAELVEQRGGVFIPPFDHPDVIAGQGTVGLEIAEDLPDVEVVLVPISGGGLISGVATAIKALAPSAQVIGVEPELAADVAESFRQGSQAHLPLADRVRTIADGLRMEPSELTYAHIAARVDAVVTVTEDEIRSAIRTLAHEARLVAEPSGAVTVAAYLNRAEALPAGRTVAIVSGGSVDPSAFLSYLS